MRKFFHYALNRIVITALIVLFQVAFFIIEIMKFGNYYVEIAFVLRLISFFVIVWILLRDYSPEVKLAWIVPILVFPLFGGILYLAFGHVIIPKNLQKNIEKTGKLGKMQLIQDVNIFGTLQSENPAYANQSKYLIDYADSPIWMNESAKYFSEGEEFWKELLNDLSGAKKYIFLEFFILSQGKMWDEIHTVLKKKVEEGVEVRILYDDIGSAFVLPKKYYETLNQEGIQCIAFNRLLPFFALILNNRDHRKIAVIDGRIAYTGGINIGDEYINLRFPYGEHWKDAGVRFTGVAVKNFIVSFLQMWNMSKLSETDFTKYLNDISITNTFDSHIQGSETNCNIEKSLQKTDANGFIQPYVDTPLDHEVVGENVYLNMICNAKRYIYIYTPYLIIGHEMTSVLRLAAKRGVDVRIVTPGVPDKKMIFWLTQSNYRYLIEAGVTIYQYKPGFIHSKCVLVDDEIASIGTVNFDYRSFYHHFECGVLFFYTNIISELKEDMQQTFASCEEITMEWCKKKFVKTNIIGPILKLFSPLL